MMRTLVNRLHHSIYVPVIHEEAVSRLDFVAVPYPIMILSDFWVVFILVSPEPMMN